MESQIKGESKANVFIFKDPVDKDLGVVFENASAFKVEELTAIHLSKARYGALFCRLKSGESVVTPLSGEAIAVFLQAAKDCKSVVVYNGDPVNLTTGLRVPLEINA